MSHFHIRWAVDRLLRSEHAWLWDEAAIRTHLAGCDGCRAYYDEGVLLLRAARGARDAPGAGELARMARRAGQAANPADAPLRGARQLAWAAAGMAAVLALGLWVFAGRGAEVGQVLSAARLVVGGADVAAGARIFEGDDVVASGGSAVVRLNGGRVVLIQEGSRLSFSAGGARATVKSGAGFFRVEKGVGRFEVLAGSATVVVKGTEFLVERKDLDTTSVVVDEGVVEVRTKAGSTQLGAGQQTSISKETIAPTSEIDLLERIRRGLQQLGKEVDRAGRK